MRNCAIMQRNWGSKGFDNILLNMTASGWQT